MLTFAVLALGPLEDAPIVGVTRQQSVIYSITTVFARKNARLDNCIWR